MVHHNLCFNLFILHSNPCDNQGSEINKNDIFNVFTYCVCIYIYIYIYQKHIYMYIYIYMQ